MLDSLDVGPRKKPREKLETWREDLVPLAGIELATFALRMRCSTN
jgi:hypothetical protein